MTFSWSIFFVFLFLYRCFVSIIAQSSVQELGDASLYQRGGRTVGSGFSALLYEGQSFNVSAFRHIGTHVTESIGTLLSIAGGGNAYLTNLGFQTIAFVGLVKLLMSVEPSIRRWLALVLILPSFNFWTSIASKEALVTLCICMILANYVRMQKLQKVRIISLAIFSILLALLKPHYFIAVAYLFGATVLAQRFRQRGVVALSAAVMSLAMLYPIATFLDKQARVIATHFRVSDNTLTREIYFVHELDILFKAPYGMFQSFFGPTVSEAVSGTLAMMSFIESLFLVGLLLMMILHRFWDIRAFEAIIGSVTLFWILFVTYPFGIMNPGSAVRYRSGYLVLVVFVVIFVFVRGFNEREKTTRSSMKTPALAE
tara:strand:- start:2191 stop:3303 length:1113 start_codon:yes stop_codon:yes gene_type:complete